MGDVTRYQVNAYDDKGFPQIIGRIIFTNKDEAVRTARKANMDIDSPKLKSFAGWSYKVDKVVLYP